MRVLFALLLCSTLTTTARAGIEVPERYPSQNESIKVTITDADDFPVLGAEVAAVFRPNTSVPEEVPVGRTGADGTVEWKPEDAGLVRLRATLPDGSTLSRDLSVPYSRVPLSGLILMLTAGVILYGGVIRGFATLNRLPADLPPDT